MAQELARILACYKVRHLMFSSLNGFLVFPTGAGEDPLRDTSSVERKFYPFPKSQRER